MNDAEHMDFLKRLSEAEKMDSRSSPGSETALAEKISLHMQLGDSGPGFHLTDVELRMIVHALKRGHMPDIAARASEGANPLLRITYTNWRGETSERAIAPKSIRFGSTEWHPEPQWLLLAYDTDKQADREFAMKDFGPLAQLSAEARHDTTFLRGWNEGIERAAELLDDDGSGIPADKIRTLIDTSSLPSTQSEAGK